MKNLEQSVIKTKIRTYKEPLPTHLRNATVDEIFNDTEHYVGLMSFFFIWSEKLMRLSWPGSKLNPQEFEDSFHDAFEILIRKRKLGKIRAHTPEQLYCFLRAIFRNIVYIQKIKKCKEINLEDLKEADIGSENYKDYDATSLCKIIDKIVRLRDILSQSELVFWDAFKNNPEQKMQIMQTLNLTSRNYDTIKHRMFRKITNLKLKNILF